MPTPNITDLQTMYGAWNPQAYLQAQQNAGLEQQLQQEKYLQEQQDTKTKSLANIFTEQDNPNRVQERVLTNRGKDLANIGTEFDNVSKGVKSRFDAATEFDKLDEAAKKHLLSGTIADYDILQAQAKKKMTSLDPAERAEGERIYGLSQHARERAEKFQDTTDVADHAHQLKLRELEATGKNALDVANVYAASREKIKGMGSGSSGASPQQRFNALTPDRRLGVIEFALAGGVDPVTREELTPDSRAAWEKFYNQDLATYNAKVAGSQGNGIAPTVGPSGGVGIVNKTPPSAGAPKGAASAPKVGVTKSGVKYKIVD